MTAIPGPSAAAAPVGRGRLGRYAVYLLRDYVTRGGFAVILFGLFMVGVPLAAGTAGQPAGFLRSPEGGIVARRILSEVLPTIAFLGCLLAANGIVSDDRKHGYFRFVFAKPVGVVRYYATAWAMNGLGLLTLVGALLLLLNLSVPPVPFAPVLLDVALYYVSLGSLGFLLSTLVRFEWVATALLWQGALLVPVLFRAFPPLAVLEPVTRVVLPPTEAMGRLTDALRTQAGLSLDPAGTPLPVTGLPAADLRHVILFGIACLVLGFVQLRRRPLSP